jgi:hemolysin III
VTDAAHALVMSQPSIYAPTVGEEIAHALSHGVGAVLAVIGLVFLFTNDLIRGDDAALVAHGVYGGSLVVLYLASTFFHAVPPRWPRLKALGQRLDHAAIYGLIAGTWTPFTMLALDGAFAVGFFSVVWSLAAIGLVLTAASLRFHDDHEAMKAYERRSIVLYLTMGWLALFALKPLVDTLPSISIALLVGGGVAYTVGVAFFVSTRKWTHSIWHLFVMAGSTLHFFSVAFIR